MEALADCAAICHLPIVEMRLRRFVEPDFVTHALPRIRSVRLVQGVPTAGVAALLERVGRIPEAALAKIKELRLFLSREAEATPSLVGPAILEARALRRALERRGVVVVPPAELARYLSEAPDEPRLTGMIEPSNTHDLSCPTCPTGNGVPVCNEPRGGAHDLFIAIEKVGAS
jgi:hypothetical protein